jgi:hypothetical protein
MTHDTPDQSTHPQPSLAEFCEWWPLGAQDGPNIDATGTGLYATADGKHSAINGTPGESRGRKATGPRLLRDAPRQTPRRIPRPPSCRTGG